MGVACRQNEWFFVYFFSLSTATRVKKKPSSSKKSPPRPSRKSRKSPAVGAGSKAKQSTPVVDQSNILLAVRNVAHWGDTDVLPFPIENHWFHDAEQDAVELISELDANFDAWMAEYPLTFDQTLCAVGYVGFRGATQIDPIWNAYLLSLVVQMGADIESARLPISANCVFSYRFAPDAESNTLFNREIGWGMFQSHALAQAQTYNHVLAVDISDFYPRVYHHRIDNALGQATLNKGAATRTMEILKKLSIGGVSYGLPIGGNAARLLAELVLNRTDRLLATEDVPFCRFVDDYYLFSDSEQELRRSLVYLSEILLRHEGLSLQRNKTRIMTSEEFVHTSPAALPATAESESEAHAKEFLRIRLLYDPYSPTADEDFDRLRDQLDKFDIVGMLARELRKSRVDEVLVRQLIKSIRYLTPRIKEAAVESLIKNLEVLYPLFPTVALVIRALLDEISIELKEKIFETLRAYIRSGSYVLSVPANVSFALRVLVYDPSEESDTLFIRLYNLPRTSVLLKRDLILCLARRGVDYWLADRIRDYSNLAPWEKRALIPASYVLGDEGRHWRQRTRPQLSRVDQLFMNWIGAKNSGKRWDLPF